jgi:hypothetical protein
VRYIKRCAWHTINLSSVAFSNLHLCISISRLDDCRPSFFLMKSGFPYFMIVLLMFYPPSRVHLHIIWSSFGDLFLIIIVLTSLKFIASSSVPAYQHLVPLNAIFSVHSQSSLTNGATFILIVLIYKLNIFLCLNISLYLGSQTLAQVR